MKSPIFIQVIVFAGLLAAATLCLTSHKSKEFSDLDKPDLYLQEISRLEKLPSFEGKEQTINLVKALVASQTSGLRALQAIAESMEALGHLLLVLALIQGTGIYVFFRNKNK